MPTMDPNRGAEGEPRVAKPYDFVPLSRQRPQSERPTGHDRYSGDLLSGTIQGTIVARSPVHVASGQLELTHSQPPLIKAHFRRQGQLTIPGSSLKGAIRSIVEAISQPASCLRVIQNRYRHEAGNFRACTQPERLCVACRLFGAMGYLGQVAFQDADLIEGESVVIESPPLFRPRSEAPLYRRNGFVRGRKFYKHGELARGTVPLEACAPDSVFRLRVYFDNLSDAQLGLLLVALGQGDPGLMPKLGGGKPACLGSVAFEVTDLQTRSALQSALQLNPRPTSLDVAAAAAVTRHIDTAALQALAEILQYPGTGSCPAETY